MMSIMYATYCKMNLYSYDPRARKSKVGMLALRKSKVQKHHAEGRNTKENSHPASAKASDFSRLEAPAMQFSDSCPHATD